MCLLSPTLFDWVLENLLKNALDAMDGKGSIQITMSQENNQLNILVKDSGKGHPE
jgi:signal transduction histidine kinase